MNGIGQPEIVTQKRVHDRGDNSYVEENLLTDYLVSAGYDAEQIGRANHVLHTGKVRLV